MNIWHESRGWRIEQVLIGNWIWNGQAITKEESSSLSANSSDNKDDAPGMKATISPNQEDFVKNGSEQSSNNDSSDQSIDSILQNAGTHSRKAGPKPNLQY